MQKIISFGILWVACLSMYAQTTLTPLPDQTIGRWGKFAPLVFFDYWNDSLTGSWSYAFVPPDSTISSPNWTVNPAAFNASMSLTAQVNGGGVPSSGNPHQLGAYIEDELVGVADGIEVAGNYLFFLTIYSHQDTGQVSLRFYDSEQGQVYPVKQKFSFDANSSIGDPLQAEALEAGFIEVQLGARQADFVLIDSTWTGTQAMVFRVEEGTKYAQDTMRLSVLDDYTPLWAEIPEQVIAERDSFPWLNLMDFVVRGDSDAVSFSLPDPGLMTRIEQDSFLVVNLPTANWAGEFMVELSVQDQSIHQLHSETLIAYKVIADDEPPLLTGIPDQRTGPGGGFANFDLRDYLMEFDGDSLAFDFRFLPAAQNDSAPQWQLQVNQFSLSMTATIIVESLGDSVWGDEHLLSAWVGDSLRGFAQASPVGGHWLYFMIIYGEQAAEEISFRFYDASAERLIPVRERVSFNSGSVIGDPLTPFEMHAGPLQLELNEDAVQFSWLDSTWRGTEQIVFEARDKATNQAFAAFDTASFSVLSQRYPTIADIPDQQIQEGGDFQPFDLDNFLLNYAADSVAWSLRGTQELSVIIDSLNTVQIELPHLDWYGEEQIEFSVYDKLDSSLTDWERVIFRVENINDTPYFKTQPVLLARQDQSYAYFIEALDVDNDSLQITATQLPTWLSLSTEGAGEAILYGKPTDLGLDSVLLSVMDQAGASSLQAFTIEVDSLQTGIDLKAKVPVRAYPIPVTNGKMILAFEERPNKNLQLEIRNLQGQVVYQSSPQNTAKEMVLDLKDLVAGHYFLLIQQGSNDAVEQYSLAIEVR
ncbi:MAG: T9SS type A sorting domain-containing protein [Bacteroidia bacterium]